MSSTRPELPPVGSLTPEQVRGLACVHCGVPLGDAAAVDLGERLLRRLDVTFRWYPRACLACGI